MGKWLDGNITVGKLRAFLYQFDDDTPIIVMTPVAPVDIERGYAYRDICNVHEFNDPVVHGIVIEGR